MLHLSLTPVLLRVLSLLHVLTCCLQHSALEQANPNHPFLADLAEKSDLFDKAATKYKAKVSA